MRNDPFKNDPFFSDSGFGGGGGLSEKMDQMMGDMRRQMNVDMDMGGLGQGQFIK